ncbi:MAG: hypothetical protein HPY50_09740 [Firmicutes bacterium]|nr:hypothetical protein [Bacillota bacterium]
MRYCFILSAMLTLMLILVSCTQPPAVKPPTPETETVLPNEDQTQTAETPPDTPNRKWARLLSEDRLTVSEETVEAFFRYYREHNKELRTLPSFEEENSPDWDELTHFVFYHCGLKLDAGEYLMTKEAFEEATARYFGDITYQHHKSSFFKYTDKGYIPIGWDDHGAVLYRLTSLEREGDVFTATFDGISLYESDFLDPYDLASPNMKAILDAGNRKSAEDFNSGDIDRLALEILLKDDYAGVFDVEQTVTASFRLKDDDQAPFTYLYCDRTYYNRQ